MHRHIAPGQELQATLPRNLFPLDKKATSHLFIAGGIGITPFLPMMTALEENQEDHELVYCTRSAAHTPFHGFLTAGARLCDGVTLTARKPIALPVGASVCFCARPEHLEITSNPAAPDQFRAVVETGFPLGASLLHEVRRSDGSRLKISAPRNADDEPRKTGSEVRVRVKPGSVIPAFAVQAPCSSKGRSTSPPAASTRSRS